MQHRVPLTRFNLDALKSTYRWVSPPSVTVLPPLSEGDWTAHEFPGDPQLYAVYVPLVEDTEITLEDIELLSHVSQLL
jgi:hypothetical protein